MGVIYKLTFSSGKLYIGQTVRSLSARLNQHRQSVSAGSLLPVHCAWRMYGEPSVEVLAEADDQETLHKLEVELIERLQTVSPDGYNISPGGDTAPSKNPLVAAKISEKARGRVVRSDVKEAISEKMRQRWEDPAYVEKVKAGLAAAQGPELSAKYAARNAEFWERRRQAGWTMPESTKEKMRGRAFTPETREKMSEAAKKRGVSQAAHTAAVAATKGKKLGPYSEDRVKKAAAGVKAAWQDPEKRERLIAARKTAWETRRAKAKQSDDTKGE